MARCRVHVPVTLAQRRSKSRVRNIFLVSFFFFSLLFFSFFFFFLFFFFPRSSSASTRVVSIPRSRVSPSFPAERSSRAIDSTGKDRFPGAFSLSLSLSPPRRRDRRVIINEQRGIVCETSSFVFRFSLHARVGNKRRAECVCLFLLLSLSLSLSLSLFLSADLKYILYICSNTRIHRDASMIGR